VYLDSFCIEVSRRWREKDNPFPPEALIGFILDMPPLFEAGKGWAYTDTGYILIGLVIEAATGRGCFDEIKERFLTPLALAMTTQADRRSLPGLAAGYMPADNAFGFPQKTITADSNLAWHPGLEWTGGGLVSSSLDLGRWGAALFGGNAMPGSYLDDLLDSIPISPDTPDIQYGAGVAVYLTGPFGPVYGHGGWIPGYSSSLRHYPEHGITIAFQLNTDIGIDDESMQVIKNMEIRLAKIAITAVRK
jgi:D-alanyl-D-alanine carboxypeptidase